MTGQANILEVLLIETDLRIITVDIIQPYLVMVDNIARLLVTQLTDTAVYCLAFIYVRLPRTLPWCTLIELFLIQTRHILSCDPATHRSGLCYAGI